MSEPAADEVSTDPAPADVEPRRVLGWAVVVAISCLVLLGLLASLPFWEDVTGSGSGSYVTILLLVLGDAIIPILPGETTLNAASVAAAQGTLDLRWVILAGGAGAVLGDSCVYWIARSLHGPLHAKLMRAAQQPRATTLLTVFKDNAALMIVFGRYVPGVRLVVNVTMGSVVRLPYPQFLTWSALAGFLWSTYTCALAYAVSSVLDSLPLASVVISGLITSGALVVIGATLRRGMKRADAERATADRPA